MSRVLAMVWKAGVQSQVESYEIQKKMVFDVALLDTIRIKGKVEQYRE